MNIRRLEPAEYPMLVTALKESRSDEPLPSVNNSIVLAAEDQGRLVGCIGAERVWCVSPLWTETKFRGLGIAAHLAEHLGIYNTEKLREMCITTNPHVEKLVYGVGFKPLLGQLWRRERG